MASAIPPEDAGAITSTELLVFAEEIARIAPELGAAMEARLLRGQADMCFSLRQLELFLGGKILRRAEQRGEYAQGTWLSEWLPEPIVVMLDDAIFTPLASGQPPMMARNSTEFLCFIAGWLRAAEERLRARDDEHPKRVALSSWRGATSARRSSSVASPSWPSRRASSVGGARESALSGGDPSAGPTGLAKEPTQPKAIGNGRARQTFARGCPSCASGSGGWTGK